jgi:hypothetical protein
MTPTATKPNQLEAVAAQMRSLLESPSELTYVRRVLFGGLHVLLERKPGGEYRLALARTDTAPSATEAATVGRAFKLPPVEWAWTTRTHKRRVYVGRGKNAGWREVATEYRVVECTWRETV